MDHLLENSDIARGILSCFSGVESPPLRRVCKSFNSAFNDDHLWYLLLKEHSSFLKFVTASASQQAFESSNTSGPASAQAQGLTSATPPPAPPGLSKQSSGATASEHGSNESAVVTVPAPAITAAATQTGAGRGGWSAQRAYRHILAARQAKVVSWVAPHDALLAFPGHRVPDPRSLQEHKVLCTGQDGSKELLGNLPLAREGHAMASLLGRYSITFGGWTKSPPPQRSDLYVRCLMDAWPCDGDSYARAVATGIRTAHAIPPSMDNPWSVLIASPPRVYDGWLQGVTSSEYKHEQRRLAQFTAMRAPGKAHRTAAGAVDAEQPEDLGDCGEDLDREGDPTSSSQLTGRTPTRGWFDIPLPPCFPFGSSVIVRGVTPRQRYGHTLTNVMLPHVPGSDPELEAEAEHAAEQAAAAGAGGGLFASKPPAGKPSAKEAPRTREALVMYGGLFEGGYSGETNDLWCLEVEREELTPLDQDMLARAEQGDPACLRHHVFDRNRLYSKSQGHSSHGWDDDEDEEYDEEEGEEGGGTGTKRPREKPDQFLPWGNFNGDVLAFGQVVTPYRLHLRWHRIPTVMGHPELIGGREVARAESLLPRGYHSTAFDSDSGYMYVYGGFRDQHNAFEVQRIRVGMPTESWETHTLCPAGKAPCGRFGAAMHVMGGKGDAKRLWIVGGGFGHDLMRDGHELRDIAALRLDTMTWETVCWQQAPPRSLPAQGQAAAAGDSDGDESAAQDLYDDLPASAKEPQEVLAPPAWLGRCLSSVALDNERILVFGGCAESVRNMAVVQCDVAPPASDAAAATAAPAAAAPGAESDTAQDSSASQSDAAAVFYDWYTPVQVMPHNTAFPSSDGADASPVQGGSAAAEGTGQSKQPSYFNRSDDALSSIKGRFAQLEYCNGEPKALVRAPLYANPFAMPRIQSARATRVGRHVHVFGGWTDTQSNWEGMLLLAPHEGRSGSAAPLVQPVPGGAAPQPVDMQLFTSAAAPEAEETEPELESAQLKDALQAATAMHNRFPGKKGEAFRYQVLLGSACGQPLGVWPPGRLAGPADSLWSLLALDMTQPTVLTERGPFWLDAGRTGLRASGALAQRQDTGNMTLSEPPMWGLVPDVRLRFADSLGSWAQRRRKVPMARILGGPYGENRQTAAADREGGREGMLGVEGMRAREFERLATMMHMVRSVATAQSGGNPMEEERLQMSMLLQLAASGALRSPEGAFEDDDSDGEEYYGGW